MIITASFSVLSSTEVGRRLQGFALAIAPAIAPAIAATYAAGYIVGEQFFRLLARFQEESQ